jgi:hypothetical protein
MNTHTNVLRPNNKFHQTTRNNLSRSTAVAAIVLALITVAAIAIYRTNQPVVIAASNPAVAYSNALEMQYAQPWLAVRNKPVVTFSNALELHYAQSWLTAHSKPIIEFGNTLELQYARPWLGKADLKANCSKSMEMLYACKYGDQP